MRAHGWDRHRMLLANHGRKVALTSEPWESGLGRCAWNETLKKGQDVSKQRMGAGAEGFSHKKQSYICLYLYIYEVSCPRTENFQKRGMGYEMSFFKNNPPRDHIISFKTHNLLREISDTLRDQMMCAKSPDGKWLKQEKNLGFLTPSAIGLL